MSQFRPYSGRGKDILLVERDHIILGKFLDYLSIVLLLENVSRISKGQERAYQA